jgi:molybdopterin-binding protein
LKGKITSVEKGQITASIKVAVGGNQHITAVISLEAAKDLDLKVGDEVSAIIKATEVIIGK